MNLLNWLFARSPVRKSPARTTLSLDRLEDRDVPAATVDLSTVGSAGAINGALFRQYDPRAAHTGQISSFLRLNEGGQERGYNTDARPLQFDESRGRNLTHSIRVADLPLVTIDGVQYRELVLDVNEPARQSKISLDELRIYTSNNPRLHGYNSRTGTLGGLSPVYDLGAHHWVKLDAGLNHQTGTGDALVDIPASALTGGTYLSLYSKFGAHNGAGGAYEQWGPGFPTAPQPSVISGFLFFDANFNLTYDSGIDTIPAAGYAINLYDANGILVQQVVSAADGSFRFAPVALSASAKFTVQTAVNGSIVSLTLAPGTNATLNLVIAGE